MRTRLHRSERDVGAILVLALVLTVIMSIIVIGLATYTGTGLRTSKVSTERTNTTAAAAAGMYFAVETFSVAQDVTCPASTAIPSSLIAGDISVTVVCSKLTTTESPAKYELRTTTSNGH